MEQLSKEVYEYYLMYNTPKDDLIHVLRHKNVNELYNYLNSKLGEMIEEGDYQELFKNQSEFIEYVLNIMIEHYKEEGQTIE